MGRGFAAGHVRLADDDGRRIEGALLPADHELWDADRTRLTVLLDPARIKRGLLSHCRDGSALRSGGFFSLVVDRGFRDARGAEPATGGRRRYSVGGDERRPVDPARWSLGVSRAGSRDPLTVRFGRPLDHGLPARGLLVADADGLPVAGTSGTGDGEESWELTPHRPWAGTPHLLRVDPALEDVAGNSVGRVFDRDLSRSADRPSAAGPVAVPFRPA